jgi:hypothetical protein
MCDAKDKNKSRASQEIYGNLLQRDYQAILLRRNSTGELDNIDQDCK